MGLDKYFTKALSSLGNSCIADRSTLPRSIDLCSGRGPFSHRDTSEASARGSVADQAANHILGAGILRQISRGGKIVGVYRVLI